MGTHPHTPNTTGVMKKPKLAHSRRTTHPPHHHKLNLQRSLPPSLAPTDPRETKGKQVQSNPKGGKKKQRQINALHALTLGGLASADDRLQSPAKRVHAARLSTRRGSRANNPCHPLPLDLSSSGGISSPYAPSASARPRLPLLPLLLLLLTLLPLLEFRLIFTDSATRLGVHDVRHRRDMPGKYTGN